VVFSNPLEALASIEHGDSYDLAILDMHMPGMNGLELANQIQKRDNPPPVIMLTSLGWRDKDETVKFAAFLTKPVKQASLYQAVIRALSLQDKGLKSLASSELTFDARVAEHYPLRILLAEDNAVNQKLAMRLLERMGYRADVAANGFEVLEAVDRQPYDLILMDVQMPEMDGLEATRVVRQRYPLNLQPRIVAMTANAMQGDREICLEAGMDDYVSKPIQVKELVSALERAAQNASRSARV